MSMTGPETTFRETLARAFVPGPSIRRTWPAVACAYGLKRTLTGVSFEDAEKRLIGFRSSILDSVTPELLQAFKEFEERHGPRYVGSNAPLCNDGHPDQGPA